MGPHVLSLHHVLQSMVWPEPVKQRELCLGMKGHIDVALVKTKWEGIFYLGLAKEMVEF